MLYLGALVLIAGAAGAADSTLPGTWVGIIDSTQNPMMLQLAEASVDIPAAGVRQADVQFLNVAAPRIEFAVKAGDKTLTFRGEKKENILQGMTDFPAPNTPFTLRRILKISSPSRYFGVYELPQEKIYIRTWDEVGENQLVYLTDSGETGPLFADSETDFFSGPGLLVPLPQQVGWKFRDDGRQLTMEKAGQKPVIAHKSEAYRTEEIRFRSGDVQLAGTLFHPAKGPAKAALVLVHGSGAVSRDFYGPIGYYFASNGIAVLAYDKRGIGGSEGNWMEADFDTFAVDAVAAANFLKTRPGLETLPLGLWGISQGGWIAPLAASKSKDIDFLVLVSAPIVSPAEQQIQAVSAEMKALNVAAKEIEKTVQQTRAQFEELRSEEVRAALESDVAGLRKSGNTDALAQSGLGNPLFLLFYRKILDYDPLPALKSIRIPALLVYGDIDRTVPVELNAPGLEAALRKSGSDCKAIRFPKGDHAIMESVNGTSAEFLQLHRFAPGYLQAMTDWIRTVK